MSSLLVVGTVAFDTVETPFGKVDRALGGSATYFSYSASFFAPVRLVSVIGNDFPAEHVTMLQGRGIDTRGLVTADGDTFAWSGRYEGDMNEAETLDTRLNVYGDFAPKIPDEYKGSEYVFLANGSPDSQMSVLDQVEKPTFVVADTMNLWIDQTLDGLKTLLTRIDALVLNEDEAKMLSGERNLVAAGEKILAMGPEVVMIKKGEYGSFLLGKDGSRFAIPAFPVAEVRDPTGAGDSFAGGVMGYLTKTDRRDPGSIRRAMVFGTVMSSFVVEDFSLEAFKRIDEDGMWHRYHEFVRFITV